MLVWIGIGFGILVAYILLRKILRAPPNAPLRIEMYCRKCGSRTNGLKCPRCEGASSRQNWR